MGFKDKNIGKSSPNKIRGDSNSPAAFKMEFLEKPLTNATRRSIIDVAEVLDTPLKLVNTKSLKMNKTYNFKIKSTTKKSSKSNFREVIFRGHNFHASIYPGVTFLGGFFWGG